MVKVGEVGKYPRVHPRQRRQQESENTPNRIGINEVPSAFLATAYQMYPYCFFFLSLDELLLVFDSLLGPRKNLLSGSFF